MTLEGWLAIGVIALVIGALVHGRVAADIVLAGGVALLVFLGILSPKQALAGMANEGMATVAVLYVVVCGLNETGAVAWIGQLMMGRTRTTRGVMLRLLAPVTAVSGLMNNTPLVTMFIPVVSDWCKRHGVSASKLMIPLSYAAILGGTVTLIGTSTNLVVHGKWVDSGRAPMSIFSIAWIGVPCAVIGLCYLWFVGMRLLPSRKPVLSVSDDPRSYAVEMEVEEGGGLAGKTIEQAGLRHLPGLYLAEIGRGETVIAAVSPDQRIEAGDRLVFVGVVESIVDLRKIRGLKSATDQVMKLDAPRPARRLVEAVVSNSCPLIGRSIRDGKFRSRYNAVVLAVARHGERLKQRIGDIVLRNGDTLLLEAPESFVEQHRHSRDFYLVSAVEGSRPVRHERAWAAMAIVGLMVGIATIQPLGFGMLHAAVLAAGLMLALRCCTGSQARRSVDWQVLVVIAASLALGTALEVTGAASVLASWMIGMAAGNPWVTLAMVYLVTMLLTEMITNNAAAVLVFSIAEAAATKLGADFRPFAFAIMMAASASFSTPIGYQTNLMVMSPGGYRFADYFKVGIPLNLLMMATAVLLIPLIWPLQ